MLAVVTLHLHRGLAGASGWGPAAARPQSLPVEVDDDVSVVTGDLSESQGGHGAPHPKGLLENMLHLGLAHLPREMDNPGGRPAQEPKTKE